jgi:hypothetical protein
VTADELKLQTKQFALRIIKLVAALPKTIEGRAIAKPGSSLWHVRRCKLSSRLSRSLSK